MTNATTALVCACGSEDLALGCDYGHGEGQWTCIDCGSYVYRVRGEIIRVNRKTVAAASAAQFSVRDAFEGDHGDE